MALTTQQQKEHHALSAAQEPALVAFWREVIVENPVYRREMTTVIVPASYTPEKAETLRQKARTDRAKWEALSPAQKLWKLGRPFLVTFTLCYALIPLVLPYLNRGSGGGLIGPLVSGLFVGALGTANSIVSERERRTWNALLLSRLSAAQILGGKIAKILSVLLLGQALFATIVLAFVARAVLPASVLLLFPLVLLPSTLLSTLVGVEASLWSKNLQSATRKVMWQGLGLGFLALLAGLLTIAAVFLRHFPTLWLVPLLYATATLAMSRRVWRRMQRGLWRAPKDFSG
jgi:hypothetical protein